MHTCIYIGLSKKMCQDRKMCEHFSVCVKNLTSVKVLLFILPACPFKPDFLSSVKH